MRDYILELDQRYLVDLIHLVDGVSSDLTNATGSSPGKLR